MLPPVMTLNNYNIIIIGDLDICGRLRHVKELDLADNSLADWGSLCQIVSHMPALRFLNLANNQLEMEGTEVIKNAKPKDRLTKVKLIWICLMTLQTS